SGRNTASRFRPSNARGCSRCSDLTSRPVPTPLSRRMLIGLGFQEPDRAREQLAELGGAAEALRPLLGEVADPDLALHALLEMLEAVPDRGEVLDRLIAD